jgi:copper chaperone CopZ
MKNLRTSTGDATSDNCVYTVKKKGAILCLSSRLNQTLENEITMDLSAKKDSARVVFTVREIDCVTCSLTIEEQVKKLNGVKDVKTAVMLDKVFVDYDPSKIDVTTIRKAVNKTGYSSYLTVPES